MRRKEVAVGGSNMRLRGSARTAAQDHLIAHKLAVVFTDCARGRLESRISNVRARSPLPYIAKHLSDWLRGRSRLRMQYSRLHEVARNAAGSCGNFPLEFIG